jgi:hypothetical protein
MINIWTIGAHALWILGLSILLATFSYRSYARSLQRAGAVSTSPAGHTIWYRVGWVVFGLGVAAVSPSWGGRASGAALALVLLVQMALNHRNWLTHILPTTLPRLLADQRRRLIQTVQMTLRSLPFWLVCGAALQGSIYLFAIPPWQHYDEPGHFEYAWLMAHSDQLFEPAPVSEAPRREMIDSMLAHDFFRDLPQPDENWWFAYTQLRHPPLYYVLASVPIRAASHLDLATQLRLSRGVSLFFFVLTVGVAFGLMSELTPRGHPLRWGVPLTMLLLPPFADVMTALNNDAGAVAASSLFLWASVRTIRRGLSGWRIFLLFGAALLAFAMKNVAAFVFVLIPFVLLFALWAQRGWQWRWLVGGGVAGFVALVVLVVGWGDAAYWYRMSGLVQDADTRVVRTEAPLGSYALQLEASAGGGSAARRRLIAPLLEQDIAPLAGKTVTVGGWVWANRPARVLAPGLTHSVSAGLAYDTTTHPVSVTTTPTFVSWTFAVPDETQALHMAFAVDPPTTADEPLQVFLDGAVLTTGTFTGTTPVFDSPAGQSGTWGGERFTNLIRNGSAEQGWPRLRPWVERTLARYLDIGWGRTPALLLASLLDWKRSSQVLVAYTGFLPLDGLVSGLAWGQITLHNPMWVYLLRGLVLVALVGSVLWFARRWRSNLPPGLRPALVLLVLALLLVWGSTVTRILPRISEGVLYPVARYTFPSIIPTTLALTGGWFTLWPRQLRVAALALLMVAVLLLNIISLLQVHIFYATGP